MSRTTTVLDTAATHTSYSYHCYDTIDSYYHYYGYDYD